jgi:UDP-N-acetylglucosamine--N-acetylmuramyl-(pentapeptide) pyrophosphoryl-undecaprenol N-acetylglucosamine transferase
VAELAAIGRPSILVPYPYAADDHQTANARAFEATGACIVLPHASFTAATLAGHLVSLTGEPERLAAMAGAAHAAGRPDAAARLADVVGEFASLPLSPSVTGVAA